MIRNFFTVAVRNFLRQRLYSFINVLGLTTGLACTLFIFLWVRDEVQKDTFHKDAGKIFHIVSNLDLGDGRIVTWPITPGPLAESLHGEFPEIALMARTNYPGTQLLQIEDRNFLESGLYADPDFFSIFSFRILEGNVPSTKPDKSWMAISRKLATKLFGTDAAIGKAIKVSEKYDVLVTAVFEDVGTESSLQFEYILPFEIERERRGEGFTWGNYDYPFYVKLTDEKKAGEVIKAINEKTSKNKHAETTQFFIQPFTEYYLNSSFENGVPAGGRIKYVQLFSIVAVFILIIASINFMNMATAKAASRMKEVGVRKVVGAQRHSLVVQFLSESLLISSFSMILALGLVYATLPLFDTLVSKEIAINLAEPGMILTLVSIVLVTGLLAGSYPAFFLSSYHPARVLKGSLTSSFSGTSLRKGLVVFQFALTVIMVASALVIYRQIDYIMSKNTGYVRESVLSFPGRGAVSKNFEVFREEALKHPGIKLISRSDNSLVVVNNQNGSVKWPGRLDNDAQLFRTVVVDYDFLETMGVTLRQGRFFSRANNDTSNFVITQRAVEAMGLKDPIGLKISQWGIEGVIIGVIDDFHSQSMHQAIDPIIFMCSPGWAWKVFVRVDAGQTAEAIAHLQSIVKKYSPEYPFEYTFLDDDFEKLYKSEKVTSALAVGFTTMAILISGLGLLGLAAYTTERKKKEIGIRKTLGASVYLLVTKMAKEFVQLSLWAALVGCPIAYYLMMRFLEGYAYHVDLSWGVFLLTALIVLTVSLVTVIFQVLKAAIANPVDALRTE